MKGTLGTLTQSSNRHKAQQRNPSTTVNPRPQAYLTMEVLEVLRPSTSR